MIKKLQALKKKKGFTLVELIVVIAIIGVLAAILVPTMLGYVTSSRVTSANSTASSLRSSINSFITDMDSQGAGIKRNSTASTWTIVVGSATKGNVDSVSIPEGDLTTSATNMSYTATSGKVSSTVTDKFAIALADMIGNDYTFSEAAITAYIQNGQCVGVVYYPAKTMPGTIPAASDFKNGTYAWDSANDVGIKSGEILGTNPTLDYAAGT